MPKQKDPSFPTQQAIRKSLHCVEKAHSCKHCIHSQEDAVSIDVPLVTCWCATRELTITWDPATKACKFWHQGDQLKKQMQRDMDLARMTVSAWLRKHSKKK